MYADYDKYLRDKTDTYNKSSLAIKIYMSLLTVEYLIQIFFKISLPLRMGYSIVSDRYVYDTVINDIAIDRGLSIQDVIKILSQFWSYIPKPEVSFLVEVPESVAIRRKNDIPSISYLALRNQIYKQVAATEKNVTSLDGTLPITELQDRVLRILNRDNKLSARK
jgi:dTMP kinase